MNPEPFTLNRTLVNCSHATGGRQGGGNSREDADDDLNDELPDILLGIAVRKSDRLHVGDFGVGNDVGNRLFDELLNKLVEKFLHCCKF